MENLKEMMAEEIAKQLSNLDALEPGSEKHAKAVDSLSQLYKLRLEEDKQFADPLQRKLDRYFRLATDAAGIILPMLF